MRLDTPGLITKSPPASVSPGYCSFVHHMCVRSHRAVDRQRAEVAELLNKLITTKTVAVEPCGPPIVSSLRTS
jgi:hypothetical protein